jgi:hypothetical protein
MMRRRMVSIAAAVAGLVLAAGPAQAATAVPSSMAAVGDPSGLR